jgi:release factor glutamine methyltransferase
LADWTTLKVLDWTAKRFADAHLHSPRLDAQLLLAHVLACTRVQLYTQFDRPLDERELAAYRELIKRRLAGEPIAYLLGEQEFWSLPFWIDEHVLVPRRDTETLIEVALEHAKDRAAERTVADLCTGSGCVAVVLANELPGARVIATELSEPAAALARRNAERNRVEVDVRVGDLFAPLDAPVDLLVSNPPYVASGDIAGLDAEVRREPRLALDGGADGLDVIRRIVVEAPRLVKPGGLLAIEHGFDQAARVAALIDATGAFTPAQTKHDLGGQPRITYATRC